MTGGLVTSAVARAFPTGSAVVSATPPATSRDVAEFGSMRNGFVATARSPFGAGPTQARIIFLGGSLRPQRSCSSTDIGVESLH
jgi:hypothetical protein